MSARSSFSTPSGTPFMSRSGTPSETPLQTPFDSPATKPTESKPLPQAKDVHMILSDVDGTLFNDDHELHQTTVDAIRHIRETRPDLPIIPVTGKQRVSCGTLIEQLGIEKFPAACLHGAIVYDNKGNIEKASSLDPKFVVAVTELMKKRNKTTMLYVHDWVAMASLEQGGKTDWEAVSRGFDPCVRDARDTDFLDKVLRGEEQIGKIFLPMDEELIDEYLALFPKEFPDAKFRLTRALPYIIEIVADDVDKSAAMAYFCDKYNVKPENVLSFGDGANDQEMLRESGFGVSMGNAMDAPREAADYETGTNNEGGVGQFLDRVFRPTKPDSALPTDDIKSLDSVSASTGKVEIA